MSVRTVGILIVLETGSPVPNLLVDVYDHEDAPNDPDAALAAGRFGSVLTNADGDFLLTVDEADTADSRPDLLMAVYAPLTSEVGGVTPKPATKHLLHYSKYPRSESAHREAFRSEGWRSPILSQEVWSSYTSSSLVDPDRGRPIRRKRAKLVESIEFADGRVSGR